MAAAACAERATVARAVAANAERATVAREESES